MGDDAERSRHRDDSDRSPRAQPTRDGGTDCGDRTAADRTDDRPSVDGLFHLCADRERRRALYLLDESEGAVPIDELVARLAEPTPGGSDATGSVPDAPGGSDATGSVPDAPGGPAPPGDTSTDQSVDSEPEPGPESGSRSAAESGAEPDPATDRVLTSLHHVHLPKLAGAGAVSYDREAGEVVPSIDERLSAVLEGARSLERSGEHGGR